MWAAKIEAELRAKATFPASELYTLDNLFTRYADEVAPLKKGARWELLRLARMRSDGALPLSARLCDIGAADITRWRDFRLATVKGATVLREIGLLSSVFEAARRDWGWVRENPVRDVRKPKKSPHRKRLISRAEIRALLERMGYSPTAPVKQVKQAVAVCFLLALRTGMRAGELCKLTWAQVYPDYCHLPETKTMPRDVPLTPKARALIDRMRRFHPVRVFGFSAGTLDADFRRYRAAAGLAGFTFHDARHTAATWLSRKVDVLTLCKIFGWTDPKMAMVYYNPDASDIVKMLVK